MKKALLSYQSIAVIISLLTYPGLLCLYCRDIIPEGLKPLSVSFILYGCLWLIIPLLAYAFIWEPLAFAICILQRQIHTTGRSNNYVTDPLSSVLLNRPCVSIHLPIYTESWDVISITLAKAKDCIDDYNRTYGFNGWPKAQLVVSDDGLQILLGNRLKEIYNSIKDNFESQLKQGFVFSESHLIHQIKKQFGKLKIYEIEAIKRLIFYEINEVSVIARPADCPGYYVREGEFAKASNLNETLRLDEEIESRLKTRPGTTPGFIWKLLSQDKHWCKFFVIRPPRMGDYILLIDKDCWIPQNVLSLTVPEFIADPSLAYTVHPTTVNNACENIVTKLISRGANLFFNYWLPFTAKYGFLFFPGHNGMIRKEALRKIQYWPENRIAEDYIASLKISQNHSPSTNMRYHGLYVNYPGVVFSESVPNRYQSYLHMIKKYVAGSFQMFLKPVYNWGKGGPLTDDIKSVLNNPSIKISEKLCIMMVFIPYLALLPLVCSTIFTLHLMPYNQINMMILVCFIVFFASNSPFWAAHLVARIQKKDPYEILKISAIFPLSHIFSAILFYIGAPFYLISTAVDRLFGANRCFTPTSYDQWRGESVCTVAFRTLKLNRNVIFLSACYIVLILLYFEKPKSWAEGFRLGICLQWGLGAIVAPFLFDFHMLSAIRHAKFRNIFRDLASIFIKVKVYVYHHFKDYLELRPFTYVLSLILLVSLFIRLWNIDYNAPYIDETFYQIAGQRSLNGWPMHYYYIAGSVYLWPIIAHITNFIGGPLAPRYIVAIFTTLTSIVVFLIGKQLYVLWNIDQIEDDKQLSGIFATIFFTTGTSSIWIGKIATYDALSLLFLSFGFLFFLRAQKSMSVNHYYSSVVFIVFSLATSYSALICYPFLIIYPIIVQSNFKSRVQVIHRFVFPLLFLSCAFAMLNYPYFYTGLLSTALSPRDIPHVQVGFIGVLSTTFQRIGPLLILVTLFLPMYIYQTGFWRPSVYNNHDGYPKLLSLKAIFFYTLGAFSYSYYYLLTGQIQAIDRKMVFVIFFISPLIGFLFIKLVSKLMQRFQFKSSIITVV